MNLLPRKSPSGNLQIDFKSIDLNIKTYRVKTSGSSDLSTAVEIVFNSFKSFFKNEMANMLAWRMAKSVEESMNTMMLSKSGVVRIPHFEHVYLNTTMLADPMFEKDYITIPIDGSVLMKNSNEIEKVITMKES